MFLCRECSEKHGVDFEELYPNSYVPCENCDITHNCVDIHHSLLKTSKKKKKNK